MVGRVLGFPVYLHPSMLLLALLVTVVYGGYAETELGLAGAAAYAAGFGFVVCLLGSVLLHELGHALTARRYGIGVRGITLELLGGWTELDRDAPTPRVDALVSLAGPAVSFVLGGLATAAALALPDRTVAGQIVFQIAAGNVIVAIFNVLPGLPLDGGRALRAGLWALIKDRNRATVAAAWCGRGIALLTAMSVVTLYRLNVLTLFGLVFILLVVYTLWQGAGQSIRLARMTRRYPLVDLAPSRGRSSPYRRERRWPRRSAAPTRRTGPATRSPSRTPAAGSSPLSTRPVRPPCRPNGGPGCRSTRSRRTSAGCPSCRSG